MKYIPNKRLIVRVDPEPTTTPGGIQLPEGYRESKNQLRGRVEALPSEYDGYAYRGIGVIFSAGSPREGDTYFVDPDSVYAFISE